MFSALVMLCGTHTEVELRPSLLTWSPGNEGAGGVNMFLSCWQRESDASYILFVSELIWQRSSPAVALLLGLAFMP